MDKLRGVVLGPKCPTCHKSASTVTDSRGLDGYVRRRHVCKVCGDAFSTVEITVTMTQNPDRMREIIGEIEAMFTGKPSIPPDAWCECGLPADICRCETPVIVEETA